MSDAPATRIVRCCHCRGMMRVAAKALSVFCPHCQKRATLESLRIVGAHPGRTLATCGDILVEPASQLNAEIIASNVVIRGRVNGPICANESLEVESTGRIYGDVKAAKLVVRDGGIIQGRIEMMAPVPKSQAPASASESDVPRQQPSHFGSRAPEPGPRNRGIPSAPAAAGHGAAAAPRTVQQIRPITLD